MDDNNAYADSRAASVDTQMDIMKAIVDTVKLYMAARQQPVTEVTPQGPVEQSAVVTALAGDSAISASLSKFSQKWACHVHHFWPEAAHVNEELATLWSDHMKDLKGVPNHPLQSSSEVLPPIPSLAIKAVSGSLPPVSPVTSFSLPFGSAVKGKHFKADLPKPKDFSKIAIDADIHRWLMRMQEYLAIAGHDVTVWAVFASQFLDKVPLQLREGARFALLLKTALSFIHGKVSKHGVLLFSVCMIMTGMSQLMALRQNGSVAEYKAAHDVLATQVDLPMVQLLI